MALISINENSNTPYLGQNSPNPFDRTSEIKLFIPVDAVNPSLLVCSLEGTLIKKISIHDRGETTLTINSSEFVQGIYLYSLIINNKEIDTKRMIITK